ncbi:hypothetical protein ACFSGX_13150 [Sphingomonas arantia]|uniref:Tetratricopeptide repeat-containing protein n=1 Tax=Sphingomonas arantia TaxID=1460676 RepID=A0ABW4U3A6_9SPHN
MDLIWREALRSAGPVVPDAFDLLDWATRLGEHGGVLRDCASLIQGFPAASARPVSVAWTVDVARASLLELARGRTLSLRERSEPTFSGRPDSPMGIGPGIPARTPPADPAELAARLVRLLGSAEPDAPALADAVEDALELARRLPMLDYRRSADASPRRLAAVIATAALADFASDVRDLALPPFGSPELLWQSARLDRHGLGPWFRNVPNIIRDSNDLFDLARMAAVDGDEDSWSAWVGLLSRRLPKWLFLHVADDLADHGKTAALDAMVVRALARRPATIELATIFYLRDAALDIGAYDIAARAQAATVALRPGDILELEILGTIHAQNGDFVQARAILLQAQALAPLHTGIQARLETLGSPAFAPFRIARGFGSPDDRYETRLGLRGALPDYPRMVGQQIAAVEV